MDVKEAVRKARDYLADIFFDEQIVNVGLEEIEFEEATDTWKVTIGFSRPWDRTIQSALSGPISRSYKVLRIDDKDGRVISVTHRALSASP